MANPGELPRISIVTASFDTHSFPQAAMDSVLDQVPEPGCRGGRRVEDSSAELIAATRMLAWWASEPDGGQYLRPAINKGFAHTSGDIMAWLNSDDLYLPWALSCQLGSRRFQSMVDERLPGPMEQARPRHRLPLPEWFLTIQDSCAASTSSGRVLQRLPATGATFWRQALQNAAGNGHLVPGRGRLRLWMRFSSRRSSTRRTCRWVGFRLHGDQRRSQAKPHA